MAAKKIKEILEGGTGLPPNPTIDIPSPSIVIPVDKYHGIGGSYVIDPATGKRTRIEGPAVAADGIRPNEQPETEQPQGEALANESE